MEQYKVITKDINKIDNLKAVYVYALTKYYEDFKTHYSTVTEDTLSKLTDIPLRTIKRIIADIKTKPFLYKDVVTKQVEKEKKRNYYYFNSEYKFFFYITNDFYKQPLQGIECQAECKGFLLKLKSICKNLTNRYWNGDKLNKSKLAEDMGISRPTLRKYLDKLLETDNLRLLDDGSLFINNKYIVPDYVSQDTNTFNYHCIYYHCLNNGVVPPDRDEKALDNLATEYYNIPNMPNWYLPEQLATRCKNLPNKVNFAYFIKALLNNDTILKKKDNKPLNFVLD